jgi:hypothetical protein
MISQNLFFGINISLMRRTLKYFALFTLLLLHGSFEGILSQTHPLQRTLRASRTATPTIDGNLDEPSWQGAEVATDFIQFEPMEGAPATEKTEVRVLYDDNNLYIAAWLYDESPDRIVKKLVRRDDDGEADRFTVMIDSYFDRRTAYVFSINASGSMMDGIITNDGQGMGRRGEMGLPIDRSWNAVWEGEVSHSSKGWTAELRIPFSMLRFAEQSSQAWGINFRRYISRKGETSDWVMVPRTARGFVSHFGTLTGIENIVPHRNIQIAPYSVSKLLTSPGSEPRLPQDIAVDGGVDFKVGISNNIMLDATINPDFGQVEADPAELNLTTFETFFPERRTFFLEGVQIFSFSIGFEDNLLYTRRIGAGNPILGAAKVSGRTAEGFAFGLLNAVTGPHWKADHNFAALRLRQEYPDNSYFGAMATSVTRFDRTKSTVSQNTAIGVDGDYRFGEGAYRLAGEGAFSDRMTLSGRKRGYGGNLSFDKRAGTLTYSWGGRFYSPDFNINDLGRLRRADIVTINASVGYRLNDNQPFGPFRRAGVRLFGWTGWNFQHVKLPSTLNFNSDWEFNNFWGANLNISANNIGGYEDRETRGNGLYRMPMNLRVRTNVRTDSRSDLVFRFELEHGGNRLGRRDFGAEVGANLRIGARLQLSASVEGSWSDKVEAWVRNATYQRQSSGAWNIIVRNSTYALPFATPEEQLAFSNAVQSFFPDVVDGRYYLSTFTDRYTREIDFTLRSDLTLSRDLSLQLYSQVFVARGRYERFRVLVAPDKFVEVPGYPLNEDFHMRNFNLNTVLRWEYLPGSVLYVVWSQNRRATDTLYDRDDLTSMIETFDVHPSNVFLLKLSYLLMGI